MNTNDEREFERLVSQILEICPGTSRRKAEVIARRMLADPGGDLLDQMFVD